MSCCCRGLMAVGVALLLTLPAPAGLPEYIRKPEPAFSWKLEKTNQLPNGVVYTLDMVSQTCTRNRAKETGWQQWRQPLTKASR